LSIFPLGSATHTEESMTSEAGRQLSDDPTMEKLVSTALKRRASHLQIQNRAEQLSVSYRIDGALYTARGGPVDEAAMAMAACRKLAGISEPTADQCRAGRAELFVDGTEHQMIVRARIGTGARDLEGKT